MGREPGSAGEGGVSDDETAPGGEADSGAVVKVASELQSLRVSEVIALTFQ